MLREGGVYVAQIHESRENYLEAILVLEGRQGEVRSVDVAGYLGFSKPSVSVAMANLRQAGLLVVEDGILRLTPEGRKQAEGVYERHRLLTHWLEDLGVDAETAAQDACRIEHVISQQSFERLRDAITGRNPGKNWEE
ncbi:MAG: metal-dependent transcriptional regulator [Eubacteriales bacterium]|nr:metal-dependent transcriptional regulator [Eubacteriales bacterium]